MIYNFNPVFQHPEHMYKCTCVLLIFLFYFRFTRKSTKHTNPIHAPTTTTSSSKQAAACKSVPANCTASPACKSALVNHEPMIKGSFTATLLKLFKYIHSFILSFRTEKILQDSGVTLLHLQGLLEKVWLLLVLLQHQLLGL